jgi:hypothetical protein
LRQPRAQSRAALTRGRVLRGSERGNEHECGSFWRVPELASLRSQGLRRSGLGVGNRESGMGKARLLASPSKPRSAFPIPDSQPPNLPMS